MMLSHLKPPKTIIHEPCKNPDDQRLKHIIQLWDETEKPQLALIGVPFDEAITAGGGRAGASEGPDAIRQALKRYGTTYCIERNIDISVLRIADCGDLEVVPGDTAETHDRLTAVISELLQHGILPITLGGGHDLSFATIRALVANSDVPVGGINVDAHLDLRPVSDGLITSGTPFRRALEELSGGFAGSRFVEMGVAGHSNAKVHYDYLKEIGGSLFPLAQLRAGGVEQSMLKALELAGANLFFSIDIDVVQQAFAPGCSAPAPVGLTPDEITHLAFMAGISPAVRLLDLMELCPRFDSDGRTAQLAAAILSYFFSGFALRLLHMEARDG
jgi:formimidoylglutamase